MGLRGQCHALAALVFLAVSFIIFSTVFTLLKEVLISLL